ncbi:MAG TPA: thioredoxin [Thiotrichales bacterium]|nr:thioredoxin [Thiotrichales bacterium]
MGTVATVELTKENFDEIVGNSDFVIVDFWAEWCGPCKSFAPIYEEVSAEFPEIVFGKVNTEEQQELAAHFQIRSIPTLMIFRDQIVIFSQPGMLPAEAFRQLIGKAKELDMEMVRKEIAEQQAQQQG